MIDDRPFKVLGLQQIAIGGGDKQALHKLWVDLFGLEVAGTYKSDLENVDEDICQMGAGPLKVEVDLMQPLDPDKRPAVHEPPLNHVGLWIDDLPQGAYSGSRERACGSRPAASAAAAPGTTSASCIRKETINPLSVVRVC